MVPGSKLGGVLLQVENLWLCPHTAIGTQLEVQAPMLTSLDPQVDMGPRAVISNYVPINPLSLVRWRIIHS